METKEIISILQSAASVLPLGDNMFRITSEGGKQTYIEVFDAAQQSVHLTGLCPFCREPIATEHAHEFCYPPEPPRK